MMVEFIGAAGAGKTFLSERVVGELLVEGSGAALFGRIAIRKVAPRNVFMMIQGIYLAALSRQRDARHLVHTANLIARYGIRREIADQIGGIHIASEGLFHRIITLERNSTSHGLIELADILFHRIPPPDVVVLIEASADTIFARRSERNRAGDVFTRESVQADVEIVEACVPVIAHIQRTVRPRLRLLRIASEEEGGGAAVAEIVAALKSIAGC